MLNVDEERFWGNVDCSIEEDNCWNWKLSGIKEGYGRVTVGGKKLLTHRVAWELTKGPIPNGMFVCHHCDNPPCCNPDHLFLGTPRDNFHDAIKKGRMPCPLKGEEVASSKLTEEQVLEIYRLYQGGNFTGVELGKRFGVSDVRVSEIVRGETWTYLDLSNIGKGRGCRPWKLSPSQIQKAQTIYGRGDISQTELAEKLGVSQGHLSRLLKLKC